MWKIGLSSCGKALTEELFAAYAEAGLAAMELSPEPHAGTRIDLHAMRGFADRYGITLWSYHLPFYPFEKIDPSAMDAQVRKNTLQCFSELIGMASDVGIERLIIHPSGEPIPDAERSERLLYARQTLNELAEVAHSNGATLCVEDLPRTCLGHDTEEMLFLTSENEKLRVCFDTNHLLTEQPEPFIRALGDKIVTTHVSDYDRVDEKHWLPGEGRTDWVSLLGALREVGYSGVWMYELGFGSTRTITRSRDLTCADFVRNANELFAGVTPTKIR